MKKLTPVIDYTSNDINLFMFARPEKIIVSEHIAGQTDIETLRKLEGILNYVRSNLIKFGLKSLTCYHDKEKQEKVIKLVYMYDKEN